jgi:hypothetical protein
MINYIQLIVLNESFIAEKSDPRIVTSKDDKRIRDIMGKSKGDPSKEDQLAQQMADSIGDIDKAYRRYKAAMDLKQPELAKFFWTRYKELGGK